MTEIDFYILQQSSEGCREQFAARLTQKVHRMGRTLYIHAQNEAAAQALNQQLWHQPAASFLPHCLASEFAGVPHSPICIGWDHPPEGFHDVMINLAIDTPACFSRFTRVAEIVDQNPPMLSAKRESYRHYQHQGYALNRHNIPSR